MCWWLFVLFACACGRVGFDDRSTGDGGAGATLTLSNPTTHVSAVINTTPIALTPTVSTPAHFTISSPLPAGVTLDETTGVIAGTPTATAEQLFVITATAGSQSASAPLDLIALPGWVVDSTADLPDTNNGTDAICAASNGACTLRAAIETANHQSTKQLVLLGAATYFLGSELDAITGDIVIAGVTATSTTIRAQTVHANYPALGLATTHTLELRDLAIDDFGGTEGGALSITAGVLDVDRCDFDNNASPTSGGVLYISGAEATFARCTFTRNASLGGNGGGWGGVIDGENAGTTITVTRSYATQNTTAWGSFSHITTGATLRLENSTLFGNTSTTAGTLATPGGIYTLVNDTIIGNINTAGDSAGIYLFSAPCHYTITNTIVAGNMTEDCNIRDLSTTITSGGGNILGDAGGNCAQYFTGSADRLSTDPGLASTAPGDHGGETQTVLLGAGSPALDTGITGACPPVDQRDLPRPVGAGCDVGAVEMQ